MNQAPPAIAPVRHPLIGQILLPDSYCTVGSVPWVVTVSPARLQPRIMHMGLQESWCADHIVASVGVTQPSFNVTYRAHV